MSARWWGHFLDQAHRGDKVVEIEPEIALAQFDKQDWRCAKTGWPIFISLEYDGKRSNLEWNTRSRAGTASLDRIDNNDRRYRDGNIQWVHKLINQMRGHMTERLFHAVCNAVAARFPAENLDVGRQLEREIHDYIKGFDGVIEK